MALGRVFKDHLENLQKAGGGGGDGRGVGGAVGVVVWGEWREVGAKLHITCVRRAKAKRPWGSCAPFSLFQL